MVLFANGEQSTYADVTFVPTEVKEMASETTINKPSSNIKKSNWRIHATMRIHSLKGAYFPVAGMVFAF
jgi:hypothetical protein